MSVRKVAVVVALCAATAAVAVPVKIKSLLPVGVGLTECPGADGMAKLKFEEFVPEFGGPGITIHVHLHNFKPNTTYGISVDTLHGAIDAGTAVTTNSGGNANWLVTIPCDGQPADPVNSLVIVYRDSDSDSFWTPNEEQALGMPD